MDTPKNELPYSIWYPTIPLPCVLRELVRRQPKLKNSIARASILADYESVYDLIDADPDTNLMEEARISPSQHYLHDLEAKNTQRGCKDLTCIRCTTKILPEPQCLESQNIC